MTIFAPHLSNRSNSNPEENIIRVKLNIQYKHSMNPERDITCTCCINTTHVLFWISVCVTFCPSRGSHFGSSLSWRRKWKKKGDFCMKTVLRMADLCTGPVHQLNKIKTELNGKTRRRYGLELERSLIYRGLWWLSSIIDRRYFSVLFTPTLSVSLSKYTSSQTVRGYTRV